MIINIRSLVVAFLFVVFFMSCGGSSGTPVISGTTSATADVTLSDANGSLVIPAGSFSSELAVTYTSGSASTSDVGNVTAISAPVTVTFSSASAVTGATPVTLRLNMTPGLYADAIAAGRSIYALIKSDGEELDADAGSGSASWFPVVGSPDPDAETFSISLFAGASTTSAVVVSGSGLRLAADQDPVSNISTRGVSPKWSGRVDETLGEHSWAVVCETELLSDGGSGSCNTTRFDPGLGLGLSPVLQLVESLNTVTSVLSAEGFGSAILGQASVQDLIRSNITGSPSIDELNAMADKSAIYNVAYLTSAHARCRSDDSIACYKMNTGALAFGEDFDDPPALSDGSDIAAHELVHAVQAKVCPSSLVSDASRSRPYVGFCEGTAEFVGQFFNAGLSASAVQERGFIGTARQWTVPLGRVSQDAIPYQTFEFYALATDGAISLVPALCLGFEGASGQIFNRRLDAAFNQTAKEAFIKAVAKRNVLSINQANYVGYNGNADWRSEDGSVKTFAADHYLVSAPFSDNDCFSKIQITSGAHEDLAAIVVSTQIYDGATVVDIGDGLFANYVTGSNEMMITREQGGQCTLDVIVANANADGEAEEEMAHSILVGFD